MEKGSRWKSTQTKADQRKMEMGLRKDCSLHLVLRRPSHQEMEKERFVGLSKMREQISFQRGSKETPHKYWTPAQLGTQLFCTRPINHYEVTSHALLRNSYELNGTRAWLNLFTLTFRALGRNHKEAKPVCSPSLCFVLIKQSDSPCPFQF